MAPKKHKKSNDGNSKTYFVEGMHCASCEILIEKTLLEHQDIEFVDASLATKKVVIRYKKHPPSRSDLNRLLKGTGYTLGQNQAEEKPKQSIPKIIGIVAAILLIFVIVEKLQLGKYVSVDSNSSLPAFFALGIVAGLSSCAALIGGLLLSLTKQWNEVQGGNNSQIKRTQPHIMFHVGRVVSFVLFGGVLGAVGQVVAWNNATFFSVLTILVSLIMFLLALQMLDIRWAQRLRLSAPKFITRIAASDSNYKGKYMPFGIGALTFFLPCGFTLVAQTTAIASGSAVRGALVMGLFALGTLPILIGISMSGLAWNSKPHKTALFNKVAGIIILFFVAYNINGQLNALSLPSLSDISRTKQTNSGAEESTPNGEKQTLNITAKGFNYVPTGTTTLTAGVPTTLIVDNEGIQGCGTFMAARGLFDGYINLKPGKNTIELGVLKKGTYKLTCSMGMVPPVIITVQ